MIDETGVRPIIEQEGGSPVMARYVVAEGDALSAIVGCTNDLGLKGNINEVRWKGSTGRVQIFKDVGGGFGFLGISDGGAFVDDGIAPDTRRKPPVA